jgi:hypothetical protein
MNNERKLSELGFLLWICRNGNGNRLDRANRHAALRREARAVLIRNLQADCLPFQREGLNRRQRAAERQGVAVLRRGQVCGIEYAVQPWGSR